MIGRSGAVSPFETEDQADVDYGTFTICAQLKLQSISIKLSEPLVYFIHERLQHI